MRSMLKVVWLHLTSESVSQSEPTRTPVVKYASVSNIISKGKHFTVTTWLKRLILPQSEENNSSWAI